MLAVNQMRFKVLAVVVALALVVPLVMMPVGAAQVQESVKSVSVKVEKDNGQVVLAKKPPKRPYCPKKKLIENACEEAIEDIWLKRVGGGSLIDEKLALH